MAANDSQRVQRIGIIGAGPAGLAALKTVLDTPQYKAGAWIPTAFEARHNVGGVWLPSAPLSTLDGLPVTPPTPLYDSLTTNLPHPVMAFSSLSFPPSTPLFPKAQVVQTYLESYAEVFKLREHILLNHRVVNADWAAEGYWVVHTQTVHEGKRRDQNGEEDRKEWHFDLLLVCNGHHNVPRYPQIPGLSTWLAAGRAAHSMFYRNPSSIPVLPNPSAPSSSTPSGPGQYPHLKNQTVLIIGGGPSGSDITSELVPVAARVLHSFSPNSAAARQAARAGTDADTNILDAPSPVPSGIADSAINKPRVSHFSSNPHSEDEGGIVYFEDGSEERGVDFCVVATGYEVSFPFFGSTSTSGSPSSSQKVSQSSNLLNHTPYPNGIPNPNFIIQNALVPSNPSLSRIDTQLRNTSWSVFPLARHLFGLPGCGFASATDAASNSSALGDSTSHSLFQTSSSSSPTVASSSTQAPNLHSTLAEAPSTSPALPPPTSLAFLGLLVRVVPLPLVEAQARAALAAWAAGSTGFTSLDWDHEKEEVLGRWEDLKVKWEAGRSASVWGVSEKGSEKEDELQMRTFISREFQRFAEEMKQFDYRDALDDLADSLSSKTKDSTGLRDRTPRAKPWERHFVAEKIKLRQAWVELERRGVAEEWVRGVGEGKHAEAEWVVFMEKVLDFGRTL